MEANRYHLFGRRVLEPHMANHSIYAFLNEQSQNLRSGGHLTWVLRKPYVREGHEDAVREYLLSNIPESRYAFLD